MSAASSLDKHRKQEGTLEVIYEHKDDGYHAEVLRDSGRPVAKYIAALSRDGLDDDLVAMTRHDTEVEAVRVAEQLLVAATDYRVA